MFCHSNFLLLPTTLQKAAPTNGEVATTPERFQLKPMRPEDELEKALIEFQQTRMRLEMGSPTSSPKSHLSHTALNFSPIGESTKIGVPRTPNQNQSNVTPLLRRLMIRNAEEDRRERDNILVGRTTASATKPLPSLDLTKYDRMSMDLSSMWGKDDSLLVTDNSIVSMVEETVNLVDSSPDTTPKATNYRNDTINKPIAGGVAGAVKSAPSAIMRALRRQTLHFTQNASLDISPLAATKENNVAVDGVIDVDDGDKLDHDASLSLEETLAKVPKICGAHARKSLEEDTLREDIVRAREELLSRAVVINKSDKRRSLLPISMAHPEGAQNSLVGGGGVSGNGQAMAVPLAASQVNRRRTLFNINAISEGGLTTPDALKGTAKVAAKRRTLLPSTSSQASVLPLSPMPIEVKKLKKTAAVAAPSAVAAVPNKTKAVPTKQSLSTTSQSQRKGTNMGPPAQIPPVQLANKARPQEKVVIKNGTITAPTKPAAQEDSSKEVTIKRRLFNSVAELSPINSPIRAPVTTKMKIPQRPMEASAGGATITTPDKRPPKKFRRSTLDFQEQPVASSSTSSSNSSVNSSAVSVSTTGQISRGSAMSLNGTGGGGTRSQRNVIVVTNGLGTHLEFIKEVGEVN